MRDYVVHHAGRLIVVPASTPARAARKVKRGDGRVLDEYLELVVPLSRVMVEPRKQHVPPVLEGQLPLQEW